MLTAVAAPAAATTLARAEAPAATVTPASVSTASPSPAAPDPTGFRLALQTEAALGIWVGPFYNQLAGARLDYAFSSRVSLGGYLGYANLKGKDGRAHGALPYAQVEYLQPTQAGSPLRFPLRFATGYLPRNGPVLRIAAGLAYAVSPRVDLITELVAPMLWITADQMELSMNLSLEIAIRL
jgi:hypothetical protein